jgi:hypothetical protein
MQVCQHCGKELSKKQVWYHRKCCSKQCAADLRFGVKSESMRKCQYCGKGLSKKQVWDRGKHCSIQCSYDSRFGEKVERNGVWIRPGKALKAFKMRKCQYCGKKLNKKHVRNHTKYCGAQCYADSRFGEKVELNGVWIRPGKALEVLKLCCAGMTPIEACQTVGAERDAIKRLKMIPEAAKLLAKRICLDCGKELQPPKSKYCCAKCWRRAKYERETAPRNPKRRSSKHERRREGLALYQQGYDSASVAQLVNVSLQTVRNWLYHTKSARNFSPVRILLQNAKTADEWTEILRNSATDAEKSDTVILVCARLHGSGGPGRYIGIASEQFWHKGFHDGACVAFCNMMKNIITTIEWRGENCHMTRTVKPSGTFVWPDEKLGRSIEITRAEFERLISLKKTLKTHRIMPATIDFSQVF